MMQCAVAFLSVFLLISTIGAPPVVEKPAKDKAASGHDAAGENSDEVLNNLEYGRYLKEVVEILENDPEFRKKIENASMDEIKSGSIAQHLSLVQHHVRTKLDEAKQREMNRLRELVGQKLRHLNDEQRLALARGDANSPHVKQFLPQHIDHVASGTFGQADLEKLIQHASKDLDEIDRKREEEFKEYEMRKEFERREKLMRMTEEERKKAEASHHEAIEKKKQHPKMNHPGSVDQMEEVWKDVDHLEPDQFNPKAFFQLHDVNGDGMLDEGEIEAIMMKEAEKVHENTPDADPIEEQEEMDRMRQHVMKEFDKNGDRMLSFDEFQTGINGTAANNDQGWQSIEDSTVYSDSEFAKFSEDLAHLSTVAPHPPEHLPRAPETH